MNKRVDDIDISILRVLTKNARASFREIAGELGIAVGTVQNHIRKMEDAGVLEGFMPVINFSKLGYDVDAIIALQTPRDQCPKLIERMRKHPNVKSIYETTGDVDLFIRVQFRTTEELRDFLMKDLTDDYVNKSVTYGVLDRIKKQDLLVKK